MIMQLDSQPRHPIKAVARRTGLSTHVIRAWEKRYQALVPQRTQSNRRLYSDEDIERLNLLKQATETGHNIGQIAKLSQEELQELIVEDKSTAVAGGFRAVRNESAAAIEYHIEECVAAVNQLSGERLDLCLRRASVAVSQPVLLESIIVPLLHRIGHLWEIGEMRVAHEHLATAIIRNFLGNLAASHEAPPHAPVLVAGTPIGQTHELGAIFAAVTAMAAGWRVIYVGADMPANEFVHVAIESNARAIALSVIYPPDDPRLVHDLTRLKQLLPAGVHILIGGRSALSYEQLFAKLNLRFVESLTELRHALSQLRQIPSE